MDCFFTLHFTGLLIYLAGDSGGELARQFSGREIRKVKVPRSTEEHKLGDREV